MATEQQKEQLKELLNNLNLGTQKAGFGDLFVELLEKVDDLEARIVVLELTP